MRETTCSCCSQIVRHTAISSKPLSNSQVTLLCSLSRVSAWLTVESACCTSAGSRDILGLLTTQEPMIEQATPSGRQPNHIEGAVAWHQLLIQVTHLHQVRHHLGVGLAQIRAIGDQPQFVFWGLVQLLDRYLPQAPGQ